MEDIRGRMDGIKRELLRRKNLLLEYSRVNRIEFFKPYGWQVRALDIIRSNTITVIPAPNKVGKCLCFGSRISTVEGEVAIGELYSRGKSFDVYAWDGERVVVARARPVFEKGGLHECYRIVMSDGSVIEAADNHRILTDCGWMFVSELASFDSFKKVTPIYPTPVTIVSIDIISGRQKVYDFTVEGYHNYIAGGLVHHNTALSICVMFSWLLGYEPWNVVSGDTVGSVRVGKCYYRGSSLGIRPPVRIRLTGEDWDSHFGTSLVPEMQKWMAMPMNAREDWIETGKDISPWLKHAPKKTKDVPRMFEFRNGSILDLMTYKQDIKLFESWKGDGWIADEPPPENIFESTSARGLFLSQGKVLMAITPLSNPWILDQLILTNRMDVGVMDGLTILDNEDVVAEDRAVLSGAGFTGEQIEQYFQMLISYEGKTKVEHLREVDTFLESVILGMSGTSV